MVSSKKRKQRKTNDQNKMTLTLTPVIKYFKKFFPFILTAAFIFICFFQVKKVFFNIPYLAVDKVNVVVEGNGAGMENLFSDYGPVKVLDGKNIFEIELDTLSASIKRDFPQLKDVVVNRVMPDGVDIIIQPRKPVALIGSFRDYPIDSEGIVLTEDMGEGANIPYIKGLPLWMRPKPGDKLNNDRITMAVELIDAFYNFIDDYIIDTVDVTNRNNLVLVLKNEMEIRMGSADFRFNVERLKQILDDPVINKNHLKYVDMRFDDVVLGTR